MLLTVVSNSALRASALSDITVDGESVSINNRDFGYFSTIKTLYSDATIHKYEITEFNESEYSANGRPLVTVEKSTQYADQVHPTQKLNTLKSPLWI